MHPSPPQPAQAQAAATSSKHAPLAITLHACAPSATGIEPSAHAIGCVGALGSTWPGAPQPALPGNAGDVLPGLLLVPPPTLGPLLTGASGSLVGASGSSPSPADGQNACAGKLSAMAHSSLLQPAHAQA